MTVESPVDILLIEDSPGDVLMVQEAFSEIQLDHRLHSVATAEAGLDFLYQRGDYQNAPFPDLILLDLNLPSLTGLEMLEMIKQDKVLCVIPVVVLTTSDNEQDILQSYARAGNCYIVKPFDFDGLVDVAKRIQAFWVDLVKRPGKPPSKPPKSS